MYYYSLLHKSLADTEEACTLDLNASLDNKLHNIGQFIYSSWDFIAYRARIMLGCT